jgi:hypothetical protein
MRHRLHRYCICSFVLNSTMQRFDYVFDWADFVTNPDKLWPGTYSEFSKFRFVAVATKSGCRFAYCKQQNGRIVSRYRHSQRQCLEKALQAKFLDPAADPLGPRVHLVDKVLGSTSTFPDFISIEVLPLQLKERELPSGPVEDGCVNIGYDIATASLGSAMRRRHWKTSPKRRIVPDR